MIQAEWISSCAAKLATLYPEVPEWAVVGAAVLEFDLMCNFRLVWPDPVQAAIRIQVETNAVTLE